MFLTVFRMIQFSTFMSRLAGGIARPLVGTDLFLVTGNFSLMSADIGPVTGQFPAHSFEDRIRLLMLRRPSCVIALPNDVVKLIVSVFDGRLYAHGK